MANDRFACFNIHFPRNEPLSIGGAKIKGTFNAEAAAHELEKKLQDHGLTLQGNIVRNPGTHKKRSSDREGSHQFIASEGPICL